MYCNELHFICKLCNAGCMLMHPVKWSADSRLSPACCCNSNCWQLRRLLGKYCHRGQMHTCQRRPKGWYEMKMSFFFTIWDQMVWTWSTAITQKWQVLHDHCFFHWASPKTLKYGKHPVRWVIVSRGHSMNKTQNSWDITGYEEARICTVALNALDII